LGTFVKFDSHSSWSNPSAYSLDLNFVGKPPLKPGESRYAIVGSWGVRGLTEGKYRYSLKYFADKHKSPGGVEELYQSKHIHWEVRLKDYYLIEKEFEIK
jgi:hypothetical protein